MDSTYSPQNAWPRVRQLKDGSYVVSGRVVPVWTWLVVKRIGGVIVLLGLLWLLGAAFAFPATRASGIFPSVPILKAIADSMMSFHLFLRELMTERYAEIGQAILYGRTEIDWHLVIVTGLLFKGRKLFGFGVCRVLVVVLFPLIARRFKVRFEGNSIVIHNGLLSTRIERYQLDGGFAWLGQGYQTGLIGRLLRIGKLKPDADIEYCLVAAIAHGRPVTIASPRKRIDCERIIQSLMMALKLSSSGATSGPVVRVRM